MGLWHIYQSNYQSNRVGHQGSMYRSRHQLGLSGIYHLPNPTAATFPHLSASASPASHKVCHAWRIASPLMLTTSRTWAAMSDSGTGSLRRVQWLCPDRKRWRYRRRALEGSISSAADMTLHAKRYSVLLGRGILFCAPAFHPGPIASTTSPNKKNSIEIVLPF